MSNNKLPSPSQISSMKISTVFSNNMLGCVLQYVKLNSLPLLGRLNKKFNRLIRNGNNVFHIFTEFIEKEGIHEL